ncbi:MAG: ATP-dependent RNA helicase HrpA [Acidimicrobiia bacterium]
MPEPEPPPPLTPAEARIERRRASVPSITYPASLPITDRRDDLLEAIRDHQVVIVAGETGSGKSTQLPKLCLELGRGVVGLIGHTQPRRVAARTIAERVAEELGTELGATVGYTVRFTDRVSDATLVKVMTDGILLAEIQHDRRLRRYDTLIIDEAHERSLNVDFLLGYLKQLLPRRPDLKVIVTSATIDTARFAEHFEDAPVIEVTGRTYPVEVRYRPFGDDPGDDRDQVQAVADAIDELSAEGPGDVLVFLSGEREIHDTADALRRLDRRNTEVLPLYARLSAAEQHRIFRPHTGRRIVLATNVAETSLTVPGVRYVVDAGAARISRYSHRLKVQRLPIEPISQASANQRAGRCGRVAPGICIRLYGEADLVARPEFTEPEILRTNLASVILQMTALGLGDVSAFPFLDPPDPRSVRDGVALLVELGALDPDAPDNRRKLTPLGRRLAQIPVDPRLARMVLEADRNGCVREVMVIAAALSIQDPRERPATAQQAATEAHRRFEVEGSDFLAYVRLWDHLREQQKALSSSQFRKLCRAEYLNYLRVREWQDLYSQLRQVSGSLGIRAGADAGHPDRVHQSLLAGLLSHLGMRDGTTREFRGARGAKFAIAPGSSLAKKPPRWVMAAELVETNRLWGRVAASVQPEWAERLGSHLATRSYAEPRWDARRGAAVTVERVALFGLPIVAGRQVGYDRVDRAGAREMFIRHALVEGDWPAEHAFLAENRRFMEDVRALEDRVRRREHLLDDDTVFAFYDRRVGPDVVSGRHFDQWWKRERAKRPELMHLTMDVLADGGAGLHGSDYPDTWRQDDLELPVTYTFEPGEPGDGVSVHVPLAVLNRVTDEGFDWQVPGFREELVGALVRSLPKQYRRLLIPIAERAREAFERIDPAGGALTGELARVLSELAGERIPPSAFDIGRVPDHLRVSFAVEDADGRAVALGKDLDELRARFSSRTRAAIADTAKDIERTGIRTWDLGTLPRLVEATRNGHLVRGHPALLDDGDSVSIRVLTNPAIQERVMRTGVRRLLLLAVPVGRKAIERHVSNEVRLAIGRRAGITIAGLADDCTIAAADRVIDEHGSVPWDEAGFLALRERARSDLADIAADAMVAAGRVVVAAAAAEGRLDRLVAPALQPAVADVRAQLARLVRPGFVTASGVSRLDDVLRYVRAIDRRMERVAGDTVRDRQRMDEVHALEQRYQQLLSVLPPSRVTSEVVDIGWMIEELRVSLFAQVLGTSGPVSVPRITRELGRVEAELTR